MNIADKAAAAAFRFEAKLHAFRKSPDGVVVSFTASPIDLPSQLLLDPLGTRYVIAMVALDEHEEPMLRETAPKAAVLSMLQATDRLDRKNGDAGHHNDMERARVRSVLLAKDVRFQDWVVEMWIGKPVNESTARQYIIDYCNIVSRSEIATTQMAYEKFLRMEADYLFETGLMARPR